MPYRSDDTKCPECGVPLGQVPLKKKCREHALHEQEWEDEINRAAETRWKGMTWRERHERDSERAFDELTDEFDTLRRAVQLLVEGDPSEARWMLELLE